MHREPRAAVAGSRPASRLVCGGCGAEVPADRPFAFRCPAARAGRRHRPCPSARARPPPWSPPSGRVRPTRTPSCATAAGSTPGTSPVAAGWSDERFVALVRELDEAVARVDGHGFRTTPLVRSASLDARLGFGRAGGLWVKDETGNVSGSHKARHLMGVLLALRVAEALGQADPEAPLAIASCGNAALAAAVVARAAGRRLLVFVPPSAEALGPRHACASSARRSRSASASPARPGIPTYLRLARGHRAAAPCPSPSRATSTASPSRAAPRSAGSSSTSSPSRAPRPSTVSSSMSAAAPSPRRPGARLRGRPRPRASSTGCPASTPSRPAVATRWPGRTSSSSRTSAPSPACPSPPDRVEAGLREVAHHRSAYMWPWETRAREHRPRHPRRRDLRLARRRAGHAPHRRPLGRRRRGHARAGQRASPCPSSASMPTIPGPPAWPASSRSPATASSTPTRPWP